MEFPVEILEKFLRDPVMAAYCIMGVELDDFQRIRLRFLWLVPHKVDSSGWGTGKSLVEWVYANLRAILIPGNQIGVYYPIFQTGKDEWWIKNFDRIRHPVLDSQFRAGKSEWRDQGCWRKEYKSGAAILLPAPGFLNDALGQVSRSFGTLIAGEYTQAAQKGEGIDELIGRLRGECYNKEHPVWCNHSLLSAHAESPQHPSWRYYKAAMDAIRGRFTAKEQHTNVAFSFCCLDWSDKPYRGSTFKKKFYEEASIIRSKRTLTKDDYRRRILGLWTASGAGWYGADSISKVLRSDVIPMLRRSNTGELFVLGQDTAPGQSDKADECAFIVWRIAEVATAAESTDEVDGKYYHIAPVFAHILKNVDAPQISGFIHGLHLAFGFSLIVMDPSGGGQWVYKEMIKARQFINGAWMNVVPLCTREEPNQADKQPIVVFFRRGSELDELWLVRFLQSDEGIIEAAHRTFREGFEGGIFQWPQLLKERHRAERAGWNTQVRFAQIYLDTAYKQATTLRIKVNAEKQIVLTAKGFVQFKQEGTLKKDAIYAAMYGYAGVRLLLKRLGKGGGGYEDGVDA